MPEKELFNHCNIKFICLEHDNERNCKFYVEQEKEINGIKYKKCKYSWMEFCINSNAQKEVLQERTK